MWVSARKKEVVFEMTDEQMNPSMGPFTNRVSRKEQRMKARRRNMKIFSLCFAALAAAVTLTAIAAAGPDVAKQRVAISMKDLANGTFVLTPLQSGTLKRDSGTVRLVYTDEPAVMRNGQEVIIYRSTYTFKGKRGNLSIRERSEWVAVSNENAPGFDFRPSVGIGTWKVVGGTGSYARIAGGGRSAHAGMGAKWLARQEGFLTLR